MPKLKEPYQCDYCDVIKKEANHWFLAGLHAKQVTFHGNDNSMYDAGGLFISKWDSVLADLPKIIYICSEKCLQKHISNWIGEKDGTRI